jgi:folate-dependent phosphoribosylglycinamide formyltransferase PurN
VSVLADDTEETLHERIKEVERRLYPLVVGRVMASLDAGFEPVSVAGTVEES